MMVTLELTVEQVATIDRALKHLRAAENFNVTARQATDEERQDARRALFVIDSILSPALTEEVKS